MHTPHTQRQSDLPEALGEFVSTLTPKGGVTIPIEVRRLLKVKPKDKIIFRVRKTAIEVDTIPMSLEDTFGAVILTNHPEDFSKLVKDAKEERVEKVITNLNLQP